MAIIGASLAMAAHLDRAAVELKVVDLPKARLRCGSVYNLHHL